MRTFMAPPLPNASLEFYLMDVVFAWSAPHHRSAFIPSLCEWNYSARLLFIILVAGNSGRKRNHYDESVIVFRASDFDDAFKRALEIGRSNETNYKNDKGQQVRWALVEVRNLDWIGPKVDGKEVASVLHYRTSPERIAPDRVFHPERSVPQGSF